MAAHLVGLGAALGCMAFRFTSGPKYALLEAQMASRADELEALSQRAAPLIDEDSRAYELVLSAYRLPKATEAEKLARSSAVQAGFQAAIAVPAETLELATCGLEALAASAPDLNPNVASDCASGGWCLRGAAEAAFLNVQINAASLSDRAAAEERLAACRDWLGRARAAAESLQASIARKLG